MIYFELFRDLREIGEMAWAAPAPPAVKKRLI
jgi:hypothetical protein